MYFINLEKYTGDANFQNCLLLECDIIKFVMYVAQIFLTVYSLDIVNEGLLSHITTYLPEKSKSI